jgi:hypothetical protein
MRWKWNGEMQADAATRDSDRSLSMCRSMKSIARLIRATYSSLSGWLAAFFVRIALRAMLQRG